MLQNLPPPDVTRLPRSPLELVVCQLRFDTVPSVSEFPTMLALQKVLSGKGKWRYPVLEHVQGQGIGIQAGPEGVMSQALRPVTGWRLSSDDKKWLITIMPDFVSLETTAYTEWKSDFRERLSRILEVVKKHISPKAEQRLGLRYIDRIAEPKVKAANEWRDYIAPEILGPILHPQLGPAITATHQQIDLQAGEGIRCSIRHGLLSEPVRTESLTYVLDFDVYREGVREFDVNEIKLAVDHFNYLSVQLFQQIMTSPMLKYLAEPREED